MGVTGCGKSTVGAALASELEVTFIDGDSFHPEGNVAKMSQGIALNDADRWPWLDRVAQWLADEPAGVIACSALKRSYRDRIRATSPEEVFFLHLAADQEVLEERVRRRHEQDNHFAPVGILDGQYADLEPLGSDESGVTVDVATATAPEAVRIALGSL